MENKNGRLQTRTRQKQKFSRRTVIIIAASCMTFLVIGLTIFFNISHVDQIMAKQGVPVKEFIIEDQHYVDDMTLAAPVIVNRPVVNETTQLMRPVKELQQHVNLSTK